jgi:hypothetical protein
VSEKIQGYLVDIFCALVIFGAGYYLHGVMNRNVTTTVIGKTVDLVLPGHRDTVYRFLPVIREKQSKDSSRYWRTKYDSLCAARQNVDSTEQDDPLFTGHLLPFKVIIRDDWTRNHLTVFPLNTDSDRVRLDWTDYDSLRFKFNYQDTTTNVIRIDQAWYDHWYTGSILTAIVIYAVSRL